MSAAQNLLVIREIGDIENHYWTAATETGRSLFLEPGEELLHTGQGSVQCLSPRKWQTPYTTLAMLTDRRLTFMTTDFDKGGGWNGFGLVSATVAAGANAVSRQRARRRSAGKVLIGHIRHEWLQKLSFQHKKKLLGQDDYTHINCVIGERNFSLSLVSARDHSLGDSFADKYARTTGRAG